MMVRMLALLLLVGVAVRARVHFDGDKVFSITPQNEKQAKILIGMQESGEFDFWTEAIHPGMVTDLHVNKNAVEEVEEQLKEAGFKYKVLIENLELEVVRESMEQIITHTYAGNNFNYNTYNRLGAIQAEVRRLASKHSDIAETFNVGKSYEHRDMIGIKISKGTGKKAVWIDGCIHAREWISCATVMFFLKQLLEPEAAYADKVTAALNKFDFYILPVFNVDGYEYTHKSNRMWRKTRSRGSYCRGADPNRNWDSHWGGVGTSSNECSDIYRGKKAFSEIEVKQVATKLAQIDKEQSVVSYWNIHAYSEFVLFPWSYTKRRASDYSEIDRVANVFVAGIKKVSGKSFRPGQPSRILYSVSGGSMDWTYEKLGIVYSYAPELRPKQGEFPNGFLLPAKYIRPSGMEVTNGLLDAVCAMKN